MGSQVLLWQTDRDGSIHAAADGHMVIVKWLLPAAEARFVVKGTGVRRFALASGIRPSVKEAMLAAEEMVARMGEFPECG